MLSLYTQWYSEIGALGTDADARALVVYKPVELEPSASIAVVLFYCGK